jgi:hypothetical protein
MTKNHIVLLAIVIVAAGIAGCGASISEIARLQRQIDEQERRADAAEARRDELVMEQITEEERESAIAAAVEAEAARTARRPEPRPEPVQRAPVPQPIVEAPQAPPVVAPVPQAPPRPSVDALIAEARDYRRPEPRPMPPVAPMPGASGMGYMAGPGAQGAPVAPMTYDYVAMPEPMARTMGVAGYNGQSCTRCVRIVNRSGFGLRVWIDGQQVRPLRGEAYLVEGQSSPALPGGDQTLWVIPVPYSGRMSVRVQCLRTDRGSSSDPDGSHTEIYDSTSRYSQLQTFYARVSPTCQFTAPR